LIITWIIILKAINFFAIFLPSHNNCLKSDIIWYLFNLIYIFSFSEHERKKNFKSMNLSKALTHIMCLVSIDNFPITSYFEKMVLTYLSKVISSLIPSIFLIIPSSRNNCLKPEKGRQHILITCISFFQKIKRKKGAKIINFDLKKYFL